MIHYRLSFAEISQKMSSLTVDDYNNRYDKLRAHGMAADPNIVFNDTNRTIEISYFGEDLMVYNSGLAAALWAEFSDFPMGSGGKLQLFEAACMTPEGKARKDTVLDESRETLRGLPYQDTPPTTPALDDNRTAVQNLTTIAGADLPGVCFGGDHGDNARNAVMNELLDAPGHGGLSLFFIEELGVIDQPLINTFLSSQAGEPMPTALENRIRPIPGLKEILVKMRDHNLGNPGDSLKAFGINSAEAKSRQGMMGLENRVAMMNAAAKQAMDAAIADNPGEKFLAFVGAAHSNTHPGGVPGIAQLMGVPAVKLDKDGKLELDPEDQALRGMPTAEQMALVEQAATMLGNENPAFNGGSASDRNGRMMTIIADVTAGVSVADIVTRLRQSMPVASAPFNNPNDSGDDERSWCERCVVL